MAIAKAILFGEHAVVYGSPAIAVPLFDFRTNIMIRESKEFKVESENILSDDELESIYSIYELIIRSLRISLKPVIISIQSNIPIGSSLGSSASLGVALIDAIVDHHNIKISNTKMNEIAYDCERIFHGTPSGIDNTVVVNQNSLYFQKGKFEQINIKKFNALLIDTGIRSDTKEAVAKVKKARSNDNEKFEKYFDNIKKIVIKAKEELQSGNIEEIGKLMYANQNLLEKIGVSCIEINKLCDLCKLNQVMGAKLIGGGLGGFIIAVGYPEKFKELLNHETINFFEVTIR